MHTFTKFKEIGQSVTSFFKKPTLEEQIASFNHKIVEELTSNHTTYQNGEINKKEYESTHTALLDSKRAMDNNTRQMGRSDLVVELKELITNPDIVITPLKQPSIMDFMPTITAMREKFNPTNGNKITHKIL